MAGTGRPSKGGQQVYVRLPDEELATLDEWVEELKVERPGMSGITRSDLIRDIVMGATTARRKTRKGKGKR